MGTGIGNLRSVIITPISRRTHSILSPSIGYSVLRYPVRSGVLAAQAKKPTDMAWGTRGDSVNLLPFDWHYGEY